MANIKRLCLYTGWMDDFRGEDQNGLLSTILRNFHSTLCGYDYASKELVFNNLGVFFSSLYKKRNSTEIPEII